MDEETLARAMEPFFTTKGLGKGTGLGLSMVHGVAEQTGGWFTLRSRKGKGTTAELWLPVAQAKAPAVGRSEQPVKDTALDRRSLVVMAVDDDELVLTNTIAMLDELGHTGIAASSGKEALNILRQESLVDLVLTDYAMPQMTGLQLAAAIKQEWPGILVIIASGFAEMDEPQIEPRLPRLAKPFTEAELAKELARVAQQIPDTGRVLKFRAGSTED